MDLVLIGGVSGSGKSVALVALEDSGYYTLNNLPVPMLVDTLAYLAGRGEARVGVSLDVRTGPGLPGLAAAIATLKARGWTVRFIYLDATVETLVKRFSETRRRHPFSTDERTLSEAIDYERTLVADVRMLGTVFDTSELPAAALRGWVKDFVSVDPSRMTLLFESFGFKHGVPSDADMVFDVRSLPNPYYDLALRPLTGKDEPVIAFLDAQPSAAALLEDIRAFLEKWLPSFKTDNRSYLTVALGCTGGQHRSVYMAERLAKYFSATELVVLRHREQS
jgi:UPF0042 nucleotide-binding protein